MNDKVKSTLSQIIDCFQSGSIPQAVAYSMFPIPNVPCSHYSLLNRTLIFLGGTQDARGFRQWNETNRFVRKGEKAHIHILVPYFKKVESEESEDERILKGFMIAPVFAVEQTEGEELEYRQLELPPFPFMDLAGSWGISVKAIPGNFEYYGYFSGSRKEICLATEEEMVFFHELSHAGHSRIQGGLKPGQDPLQEIVAELSAQALAFLVGKDGRKYLGNSYRYIERYAEKIKLSPYSACLRVMSEVEQVLNLITGGVRNATQENRGVMEEVG